MSRNLRNRPPVSPPTKEARRGPKITDSSSDDDYDAVDLISDTEEDEPDVEVAEEEAIIASEAEAYCDADDVQPCPRPSIDDDQDSWAGFDLSLPETVLAEHIPSFEDHMAHLNTSESEEIDLYGDVTDMFDGGFPSPSTSRRVRFDLSDSGSDHSDSGDSVFPDIFLDQNSLNPSFRRRIEREAEHDDDAIDSSDDDEVLGSDDEATDMMDFDDDDDSSESNGDEIDEGDTTEEDLPHIIKGSSVLRSPASVSSSSADEEITPTRRRDEPRLGSWTHNARKPFVVLDGRIKKLIVFGAKIGRRFTFDGITTESSSRPFQSGSGIGSQENQVSPMIGDSTNLMMSALIKPMGHSNSGAALGPPEAFYPYVSTSSITTRGSPSTLDTDDEVDDEFLWKLDDFIDFNDDSSSDESDGDQQMDTNFELSSTMDPSSTPARPTSARSEDQVHPLLANRGLVGAFRQAQDRHQLLSRNVVSSESLAFSGPYRQGTLRGMKGDRLAAANTPITPMRKDKALSAGAPLSLSPESPLAAAIPKKRKFSGEQSGHKRSRSMM